MTKREKRNYILFILIILSSVGFFNPLGVISDVTRKFLFYAFVMITWFIVWAEKFKVQKTYPIHYFRLLILGIIGSVFMVQLYQNQNFISTIIATFPFLLAYMCFPLLMRLNIDKRLVIKTISILIVSGMIVYLCNLAFFPSLIFGKEQVEFDLSRGMVRLSIPFIELFVLMFFYNINKWVNGCENALCKWSTVVLAVFIVLSVTRQYILFSFLLGGAIYLTNASIKKRIFVFTILLSFYFLVLPNIPIYKTMVELSEKQAEKNNYTEEDIRIQAWRFYTYEYQTNGLTPIFGNGVPSQGKTPWGKSFERTTVGELGGNRCYGVDVGWAGFFWYFGAIATFGLLMLLISAIRKRKSREERYLGYWMVFIGLISFTSGPILYYHQILSITIVLYLVYGKDKNQITYENSSNNSQLQ